MGKRGGAIRVATTRRHYKGRVYDAHLLRRSYREDGKVTNETLGNLSHLPGRLIEIIRRSLKGEVFLGSAAALGPRGGARGKRGRRREGRGLPRSPGKPRPSGSGG